MKSPTILFLQCAFVFIQTTSAQTSATYAPINTQNITIVRDFWGVPHIKAHTNPEAAYGLAYAHAEDDFASIQEIYAAGSGRAGRLKGAKGAAGDYALQLLRIDKTVEAEYEQQVSPEFKAYLNGYCQGINAYAAAHPEEVKVKKVFPIRPQTILKGYALALSLLSGLDKTLGKLMHPKRWKDTLPAAPVGGSNSFAMNGKRMDNGQPTLIVNAHQPLEGGVAFYEAHVVSDEGMNMHGGTFPGCVSLCHGTNMNLGWAHTANSIDKMDVFKLEMKGKRAYKFDGEWLRLERNKAKLKIKGIPFKIKKKIYWSKYGATIKTKAGFFAVKLFGNEDIRAAEQWWRMGFSKNYTQFHKTLEMQAIPIMNVLYADRYDTTFFINNSVLPDRAAGYNWRGIVPGNITETRLTKRLSMAACPQILQPKSGYIYNTNHASFFGTAPADAPKKQNYRCKEMGFELKHNDRSLRFEELWAAETTDKPQQMTMGCLREMKYDKTFPKTSPFLHNLDAMRQLDPLKHPDIAPLIAELRAWNGTSDTASTGATVFYLACLPMFKRFDNSIKVFENDLHLTETQAVSYLENAKKHLEKHFHTLHLPFGKLMRLQRGDKNYPMSGFPDVLAAMYGKPQKNGTMRAFRGDDFILYVEYDKAKKYPTLSSVKAYGESARPESPHYNDQMELFLNEGVKPMSLDWNDVQKWAKRTYSPLVETDL